MTLGDSRDATDDQTTPARPFAHFDNFDVFADAMIVTMMTDMMIPDRS